MKKKIEKTNVLSTKLSLFAVMALLTVMAFPAQHSYAQVVPYKVEGTGIGSLLDLTAVGDAVGTHLGHFTYIADQQGVSTQVAADGSVLQLQRVQLLLIDTSDPDPETGLVVLTFMDELQILGGTGRFQNAQAVEGNIISFLVSEPFDPNGDLTAIPFEFKLLGQIDLGNPG